MAAEEAAAEGERGYDDVGGGGGIAGAAGAGDGRLRTAEEVQVRRGMYEVCTATTVSGLEAYSLFHTSPKDANYCPDVC